MFGHLMLDKRTKKRKRNEVYISNKSMFFYK